MNACRRLFCFLDSFRYVVLHCSIIFIALQQYLVARIFGDGFARLIHGGRELLVASGQRSTALLLTLFTFCPPGPLLRTNVNWNSEVGIRMRALTVRIVCMDEECFTAEDAEDAEEDR